MFSFIKKCHVFLLILFIAIIFTGCSKDSNSKEQSSSKSAIYFDTPITITIYYAGNNSPSEDIFQDIFNECAYYESICNRHNVNSEISKLNSRSLQSIIIDNITMYQVSPHLYNMIKSGYDAHVNYSTEFDITVTPLIDLWDFSNQYSSPTHFIPSHKSIQNALKNVNSDSLILKELDGKYLIGFEDNNTSTQIDLGGLAKGYIADQIKSLLIDNGIERALINLGGNIYALGSHIDDSPYTIGIKKPFTTSNELIHSVNVTDKSVVTSGIYERYFKYQGEIYHHILSPSTGYPVQTDLLSVTIIADSSLDCDILSTTCLLIGKDLAMNLIEGLDNVSAIFVTTDYDVITVD